MRQCVLGAERSSHALVISPIRVSLMSVSVVMTVSVVCSVSVIVVTHEPTGGDL